VTFQIVILPSAERELSRLDPPERRRLDERILSLSTNPRPPGVKALRETDGAMRVRVGEWRIIYRIEDARLLVLIVRVGHRRDVYRVR
jgi:mRNA interferase RelE/StbE